MGPEFPARPRPRGELRARLAVGEAECGLVDPATDPCVDQTSTFYVRVHAAEDYSGGGDCGKYEIKVTGRGGSPCDFTSACEAL